jgi:hypothetical protein
MRSHSSPRWLCLNHEPHTARIRSRPRLRPEELSWWRRINADDARRCESGVWHASLSARRQCTRTARGSAATDGFGWHYGLMAGLHVSKRGRWSGATVGSLATHGEVRERWKTSADTSLCLKLGQPRGTQRTAGIVTAFRVHFGYIHWARAAMVAGQLLKSTGGATGVGSNLKLRTGPARLTPVADAPHVQLRQVEAAAEPSGIWPFRRPPGGRRRACQGPRGSESRVRRRGGPGPLRLGVCFAFGPPRAGEADEGPDSGLRGPVPKVGRLHADFGPHIGEAALLAETDPPAFFRLLGMCRPFNVK